MTRDEARAQFMLMLGVLETDRMNSGAKADAMVTRFVNLGMLKLDEPESAWGLFLQAMAAEGYSNPHSIALRDVWTALERAGLEIVQK